MKTKHAYKVKAVAENGNLVDHPAFGEKEFVNPQAVWQEIIDTEQRVSHAIAEREIPKEEDRDFLDTLKHSEIVIIEVHTFGDIHPPRLVEGSDKIIPGTKIKRPVASGEGALLIKKDIDSRFENLEEIVQELQADLSELEEKFPKLPPTT